MDCTLRTTTRLRLAIRERIISKYYPCFVTGFARFNARLDFRQPHSQGLFRGFFLLRGCISAALSTPGPLFTAASNGG